MEAIKNLVESLYDRTESYIKTSYELTKLKGVEAIAKIVTTLITKMSVVIVFILCALILSIGMALWLGELLEKVYYGFFIVGAFYLITGLVLLYFLQGWIRKPVSEMIIKETLH